jgi:hypothetical protein
MRQSISDAHGVLMDFYVFPEGKPIAMGLEFSYNQYGQDKSNQVYTFSDGSTAPMNIVVNNGFMNFLVAGRYYFHQGKVQPYVTGKFGYSHFVTSLNIYDPDDRDHCEPVDTNILKRDGSIVGVLGAGFQFDLSPKKHPRMFFANLNAQYTSGGNVEYMNVDSSNTQHAGHTSDVYSQFMNNQTQVVHEHHVGNVYSNWLNMVDVRLTFAMRFGNNASTD